MNNKNSDENLNIAKINYKSQSSRSEDVKKTKINLQRRQYVVS